MEVQKQVEVHLLYSNKIKPPIWAILPYGVLPFGWLFCAVYRTLHHAQHQLEGGKTGTGTIGEIDHI